MVQAHLAELTAPILQRLEISREAVVRGVAVSGLWPDLVRHRIENSARQPFSTQIPPAS